MTVILLFHLPRVALRKERPPLEVYLPNLPGAINYTDHARKLRAQCKVNVKCTQQTWDHSAQAASRLLEGFMTDRFPENPCPLAWRFALLSRQRQITPVRRAKIWWGNSLAFLLSLDSINRDLFKVYMVSRRLASLLAGSQGVCTEILESRFYKLEVKKD